MTDTNSTNLDQGIEDFFKSIDERDAETLAADESESAHQADNKRPTPLTLKSISEKLRSTEPISDDEKKDIEGFFEGKKPATKRPFVPKDHLTQRPFQGDQQLLKLRAQLAAGSAVKTNKKGR